MAKNPTMTLANLRDELRGAKHWSDASLLNQVRT